MTYRDLKSYLENLTEEQLDKDVTVMIDTGSENIVRRINSFYQQEVNMYEFNFELIDEIDYYLLQDEEREEAELKTKVGDVILSDEY